ncbi:NADH-quinone oxidoreductase subunit L [candidate division FCPU426 bacterium]|nr:NADH-quinone oxidoreductase subunit L [candidate division FCPU426 bacterium]
MLQHAWIIPLLPLLAAALVALLGRRGLKIAGYCTSAAVFFSLIISLRLLSAMLAKPVVREFSHPWLHLAGNLNITAGMLLDPLAVVMLVMVTFISLMVQIYSLSYMAEDEGQVRYFSFMSLFTFSMLGLVLADNLILMYMFWELVGLSSYLLIGFWYYKPAAAAAGKKAFVVTRFGDLGFLLGILMLGYFFNTFNILEIGNAAQTGKLTGGLGTTIALLLFAGAVGKSAQFPLHVWLPDAMEGPTPVSALIHAATMVAAGVFLVARIFPVFAASETALNVVAYLGGFTAFFAASIACVQDDIKRILAYSTVSQLGYMMMALGCGGYFAGTFHLLTHAAFKALLFLAAGSVIHAVHTNTIWNMGGLFKRMWITGLTMLVAALALSGFFPFAGFFSKDAVLFAATDSGRMDLLVVGILTAFLTSFYIFRMFFIVFTGKPASGHSSEESPPMMTMPLLALAVLSLGLGLVEKGFERFIIASAGADQELTAHHNRVVPMFAFLAALFGFGWAYLVYFQRAVSASLLTRRFSWIHQVVKRKYYVDETYIFIMRYTVFVCSAALAWFDRRVVDGAVNGVAWLCRWAGEHLRRIQVGRLQAYLVAFVVGLIVITVTVFATSPAVTRWLP